jgi:hypothetical protein
MFKISLKKKHPANAMRIGSEVFTYEPRTVDIDEKLLKSDEVLAWFKIEKVNSKSEERRKIFTKKEEKPAKKRRGRPKKDK